ncbi:serine hydrolase [Nocardiopsis xinjiangensis]|uniref:serine hydrolase n=1 Tax=Nocardiopsis xinjiangensis TaxID=124285 RepID=UPI000476D890|nr:serine hydrolase [Nocardiopsis xinjiangensis]
MPRARTNTAVASVTALAMLVALPASGAPSHPDPRMVEALVTWDDVALEPFDPVAEPSGQVPLGTERRTELTAELDVLAESHDFGLAVQDLRTGATFSHGAHTRFPAASVAKLSVLAMLVRTAEQEGRDLTDGERAQAEQMIRYSDNEVTDDLYDRIGFTEGFQEGAEAFGLHGTEPHPGGRWGSTTTTASDQIRLLRALYLEEGPLTREGRAEVRGFMESVAPEQVWGVAAVAGPDDTVGLKNGWTPREDDGGLWTINSVGYVAGQDREYLLAVLSDGLSDYGSGIAMVEDVVVRVTGAMEEGAEADEARPAR